MKTIVQLDQEAFTAMKACNFSRAVELWRKVLEISPHYDQGSAQHNVAQCYEYLGDLESARLARQKAIEAAPYNPVWLGGYASFLFRHGDPSDALKAYVTLLRNEQRRKDVYGMQKTILGIRELAKKLGRNDDFVNKLIQPE